MLSSSCNKNFLLILIGCIIISLMKLPKGYAFFYGYGSLQFDPVYFNEIMTLPSIMTSTGDILIDNFEYWDTPFNHGWKTLEPQYPVFGYGIYNINIFRTSLDLQQGSRVLESYRPPSLFLIGTPYEKYGISYDLFTPSPQTNMPQSDFIDLNTFPILCFKFKSIRGIQPWEVFEVDVFGLTNAGYKVEVIIEPVYPENGMDSDEGYYPSEVIDWVNDLNDKIIRIRIGILRIIPFFDPSLIQGSWHTLWIDIFERTKNAVDNFSGISMPDRSKWYMKRADTLNVKGLLFRVDDIIFKSHDLSSVNTLDIFEPGPRYAQIFEPYRYLLFTDYKIDGRIKNISELMIPKDLNKRIFITEPDEITDAWVSDLLRLNPNYFQIDVNHPLYDPNYTNRWFPGDPNFGKPDPVLDIYLRRGFFIDARIPVFADQNYRVGGTVAPELRTYGILSWNATIGGYGVSGVQAMIIQPLPINPYDGMPTYMPNKYYGFDVLDRYGKPHFGPVECFNLESALWNVGVEYFPNIAYIDYTPTVFEDLIITIEVTNGITSEVLSFPLSVVNYPVENYPPYPQPRICPRLFPVGETSRCIIFFLDPDCFIFSMAQFHNMSPSTTHLPGWPINDWSMIRNDQDMLTYRLSEKSGLSVYQFGPWAEDTYDPHTGLIEFTPLFEGIYQVIILCSDNRGATGFGERPIICINEAAWLNHPPIILSSPSDPQVIKAGEDAIIKQIIVEDPDGGQVFASSNLGCVGRTTQGDFIWEFESNFPGIYNIEITFYDVRGGYTIIRFPLHVKPWWSF